jgi:hypothetical protein
LVVYQLSREPICILGVASADMVYRDIRTGWRALRSAKGFSFTVIATLALGIGAARAIFSVVDHVLLARCPTATPTDSVSSTSVAREETSGSCRTPPSRIGRELASG